MKHELIPEAIKDIADDYKDAIMALVEQAVTQGAIFGEVHMDMGNAVRRDLLARLRKESGREKWSSASLRPWMRQRRVTLSLK